MAEGERLAEFRVLCESIGFDLDTEYCARGEMIFGIRQCDLLPLGADLPEHLRFALLENVRLAILRTAASGFTPSVAKQANLRRWRFLFQASPTANVAYAAVLDRLGIPIPEHMMRSST